MVKNVNCSKCGIRVSAKNLTRHQKSRTCISDRISDVKLSADIKKPCEICGTVVITRNLARHKKSKLCQALKDSEAKTSTNYGEDKSLKRFRDDINEDNSCSKRVRVNNSATDMPSTSDTSEDTYLNRKGIHIKVAKTAFKRRMTTVYLEPNQKYAKDPPIFLREAKEDSVSFIEDELNKCELKVNLFLLAEYEKPHFTDEVRKINFKTKNKVVLATSDIQDMYETSSKDLLKEMEEFQTKGSGWSLKKIDRLELRINRYKPLRGSSYIELPAEIKLKKAVINVKNTQDQKCFLWSILAGLYPAGHSDRVSSYRMHEHKFDKALRGIQFPVQLKDISKFEKRTDISINVYSYKKEKIPGSKEKKISIYPLLITDEEKVKHIDLLFMKDGENSHYCYIKNFSRLVRCQLTKHRNTILTCKRCLLHFTRNDLLEKHKVDCKTHDAVRIVMPSEDEEVKFKSHYRKMRVPFTIYADFESMLKQETSSEPPGNTEYSYTRRYQLHNAISFCLYVVCSDGPAPEPFHQPITYFGLNAGEIFLTKVKEVARLITNLYSKEATVPMTLTSDDRVKISNSTVCHICEENLSGKKTKLGNDDYAVRDHDHLTGRFRGMAHNSCNLRFHKPKFIPLFIHNLSGYDTHLFIKSIGPDCTVDVIPNTEENYISYTVKIKDCIGVRFLDSFRFMASSLDKLSSNLERKQFEHVNKHIAGDEVKLVTQKCSYPYDYMDEIEKYDMTRLPEKRDFHNTLKNRDITDEEYIHAQTVWTRFKIKSMREYTVFYNKIDVLLLADVMENFRNVCLRTYELDPAWYFTVPGLSWEAMLKSTKINLQLLTDYDMILMITKGIRGGLSQCSHRHAVANNPYMKENYDETEPTKYLMYWDANNLYGWAQSQPMPYGDFKWCDSNIDVTDVLDDSHTGYILEVDLEYPEHHHDLHSEFPLAPEHQTPPGSNQPKLLATVNNRERYVVHYRALKQYLSLGMKIIKVHRVLSFSQKAWLKPYIDINTKKRTEATTEFEKDFYKLMVNSVFGKTVENIRKRIDIKLVTKPSQVERLLAKPNFKDRTIFSESLAAIHMSKTKLLFNKPIYIGMSILDISKTLMYDFHYNIIKRRYRSMAKLLYTDTDSLVYIIETPDIYNDINSMIEHFDTSNYQQSNRFNIPSANKGVIGKMKDELCGRLMIEFVGLRAKMYAMEVEDQETIKKSKGIASTVMKKDVSLEVYKDVLNTKNIQFRTMNTIRSFKHTLYSVEQRKVALSANDDKRFICSDGIKTLPWGHFQIPQ